MPAYSWLLLALPDNSVISCQRTFKASPKRVRRVPLSVLTLGGNSLDKVLAPAAECGRLPRKYRLSTALKNTSTCTSLMRSLLLKQRLHAKTFDSLSLKTESILMHLRQIDWSAHSF